MPHPRSQVYRRRFLLLLLFTVLTFMGTRAYAQESVERPHDFLNRAEAVTAVLRSEEHYAPQVVWFTANLPKISLFTDTDQNTWYTPFLEVAFLEGIITPTIENTFRPAATFPQSALKIAPEVAPITKNIPANTASPFATLTAAFFNVSDEDSRAIVPVYRKATVSTPLRSFASLRSFGGRER